MTYTAHTIRFIGLFPAGAICRVDDDKTILFRARWAFFIYEHFSAFHAADT